MYTNRLINRRPHTLQWGCVGGGGSIKIAHEYNSMRTSFAHGCASVIFSVYNMGHYNCEFMGARTNYRLLTVWRLTGRELIGLGEGDAVSSGIQRLQMIPLILACVMSGNTGHIPLHANNLKRILYRYQWKRPVDIQRGTMSYIPLFFPFLPFALRSPTLLSFALSSHPCHFKVFLAHNYKYS